MAHSLALIQAPAQAGPVAENAAPAIQLFNNSKLHSTQSPSVKLERAFKMRGPTSHALLSLFLWQKPQVCELVTGRIAVLFFFVFTFE